MFKAFNFFKEEIMERLEGENLSIDDLANALELTVEQTNKVLDLQLFNHDILSKLAAFFGTSEEYYNNLRNNTIIELAKDRIIVVGKKIDTPITPIELPEPYYMGLPPTPKSLLGKKSVDVSTKKQARNALCACGKKIKKCQCKTKS